MIQEVIVTSHNGQGQVHIAPMGIHVEGDKLGILPFRPSTTLDNILKTRAAVINYCDDVRVFAGCLSGKRDWPVCPIENSANFRLENCLAHSEVELIAVDEHELRPKLHCECRTTVMHRAFQGFNRAQYSVLEAAILVSRLDRLPSEKVKMELDYLKIGLDKTAGPIELEAWEWLMEQIEHHRQQA